MERLGTLPFVAQPGEQWMSGYNTEAFPNLAYQALQ